MRTNQFRGYYVVRTDIEKISKQYEVIGDIIIYEEYENTFREVTEVTQVTDFKGVSPSICSNSSATQSKEENEAEILKVEQFETDSKNNGNDNKSTVEDRIDSEHGDNFKVENKQTDINNINNIIESNITNQNVPTEIEDNNNHDKIPPTTPSKSVTSVTSVTATPPQYPCYFCGTNYQTNIDFDMGNHFVEKHKSRLIGLPISGNLETRIEWVITETKKRLFENAVEDQKDDDEN